MSLHRTLIATLLGVLLTITTAVAAPFFADFRSQRAIESTTLATPIGSTPKWRAIIRSEFGIRRAVVWIENDLDDNAIANENIMSVSYQKSVDVLPVWCVPSERAASVSKKWGGLQYGPDSQWSAYRVVDAVGWPWPAFCGRYDINIIQRGPEVRYGTVHHSFQIEPTPRSSSASTPFTAPALLPYDIIPVGILMNVSIYSLLIFFSLAGCGRIIAFLRLSKGLCPSCKYDLRGIGTSAGCSECGWNRPEGG